MRCCNPTTRSRAVQHERGLLVHVHVVMGPAACLRQNLGLLHVEIAAGVHVADNPKRLSGAALLKSETSAGADVAVEHACDSVEDDGI